MSYQKLTAIHPWDCCKWWNHKLGRYKTSPAFNLNGWAFWYSGNLSKSGFNGSTSIQVILGWSSKIFVWNTPSEFLSNIAWEQILYDNHGWSVGG